MLETGQVLVRDVMKLHIVRANGLYSVLVSHR